VKPANVIEAAGVYKLIDFGIAAADALDGPAPEAQRPRVAEDRSEVATSSSEASVERTTHALGAQSGTAGYVDPICVATGAAARSRAISTRSARCSSSA